MTRRAHLISGTRSGSMLFDPVADCRLLNERVLRERAMLDLLGFPAAIPVTQLDRDAHRLGRRRAALVMARHVRHRRAA